jgi:hypothetical protein
MLVLRSALATRRCHLSAIDWLLVSQVEAAFPEKLHVTAENCLTVFSSIRKYTTRFAICLV